MVLYGIAVACFVVAGTLDIARGDFKLGVTAYLFAVVNGVIFFWR